jgi:hypothetical protein
MTNLLVEYMPWLLSAVTIWMTLLAGKMHPKTWLVGLLNQLLWLIWVLLSGTVGLLPLNAVLWWVYWRNNRLWNKKG